MTLSAVSLADEWIPIRPGTDVAMMSAMAYVMHHRGAARRRTSSERCCVGFDASQMPAGAEGEESYEDYILGTRDGVAQDAARGRRRSRRCRAETIARIAREYATAKPGVLYQGYGMQRRAYGEQVVRAGCVLAAITGNVGVPGGWASGLALQAARRARSGPSSRPGDNPVTARDPRLPLDRGGAARQGRWGRSTACAASSGSTTTSS